jgi:hypothetical protein
MERFVAAVRAIEPLTLAALFPFMVGAAAFAVV